MKTMQLKKRKKPNEFTEFGDAVESLKMEVLKALKFPQMVEWLSKRLTIKKP